MKVNGGVDILKVPAGITIQVICSRPPFQLFEAHAVFFLLNILINTLDP